MSSLHFLIDSLNAIHCATDDLKFLNSSEAKPCIMLQTPGITIKIKKVITY